MTQEPYGSWKSPISAKDLTKGALRLGPLEVSGDTIYWLEGRPEEKGRSALMSWKEGKVKELLPNTYNVRTLVHEYGGGAFIPSSDGIFFINFADQALYHYKEGEVFETAKKEQGRFANFAIHPDHRYLYAVYEEHGNSVENAIVCIDRLEGSVRTVASGHDFYTTPIISPDGKQLAFITWDVPAMPWDVSTLWVCEILENGRLGEPKKVTGGNNESIIDPKWGPDGTLYYCSDQSGFWNIYTAEGKPLCKMDAEFGYPHWVFGVSRYGFIGKKIAALYTTLGTDNLGLINPATGNIERIDLPFTSYGNLRVMGNALVFSASDPKTPDAHYHYHLGTKALTLVRQSAKSPENFEAVSLPETIEFPTTGGKKAYAFYYPPKNANYRGLDGELPPLLVQSHGGPTAQASPSYSSRIQYWTSRGFGFVDVNYGGSTGYGREYRNRLLRNWGVVDVDDCVNAALYLAEHGKVDKNRLAIRGGSAGGYTTLAALAFRNVFKAGASYYGVSDIEALANDSHKFEKHYDMSLIGPFPESQKVWKERSPIYHTENISCPMILFQGDEDKIVPPNQAEKMVATLKKNGLPVAYILFKGEQHGFRKAENIIRCHEAELYFYGKIFGFTLADEVEPVKISGFTD